MVYFQTENTNLGKFWRASCRLENVDIFYGQLEYFMDIPDILLPFGTICVYLIHFFQTKNPNLGKFWTALCRLQNVDVLMAIWNLLHTDIWDILSTSGTLCVRLVHFSGLGVKYHEKSGNTVYEECECHFVSNVRNR
jgi:hypothetical protein